jgi:hypothetical protein
MINDNAFKEEGMSFQEITKEDLKNIQRRDYS